LVLTPDSHWIIILTGANRKPAKTIEEKATLLDSILAYSGKYTVEGDKITTHVDMSSNEIYTGANQDQTRFFRIEGNKLTIRTPEIVSAVRPGPAKKRWAPSRSSVNAEGTTLVSDNHDNHARHCSHRCAFRRASSNGRRSKMKRL
ncbi:MAG: lipocalin-like domain-containing protein, partial [Xanthobacteraceae bacterium]